MPVTLGQILFRTAGAWGVGKGTNLLAAEVDENFYQLVLALIELQDNPVEPNEIVSFTIEGNQLSVNMENGDILGPYTLPVASFNWTGIWQPSFDYELYDLFSQTDGLYLVIQAHTSDTAFNADAGNMSGPYAVLIVPIANMYDVGFFFPGVPGNGIEEDEAMFTFRANRAFFLPANLAGTTGGGRYEADGEVACAIVKNDTEIGTCIVAAGETEALFVFPTSIQFEAGDTLRVIRPETLDGTLRDFTITFAGIVGETS